MPHPLYAACLLSAYTAPPGSLALGGAWRPFCEPIRVTESQSHTGATSATVGCRKSRIGCRKSRIVSQSPLGRHLARCPPSAQQQRTLGKMVTQETGCRAGSCLASISDSAMASTDTTELLPHAAGPNSIMPVRICNAHCAWQPAHVSVGCVRIRCRTCSGTVSIGCVHVLCS